MHGSISSLVMRGSPGGVLFSSAGRPFGQDGGWAFSAVAAARRAARPSTPLVNPGVDADSVGAAIGPRWTPGFHSKASTPAPAKNQ